MANEQYDLQGVMYPQRPRKKRPPRKMRDGFLSSTSISKDRKMDLTELLGIEQLSSSDEDRLEITVTFKAMVDRSALNYSTLDHNALHGVDHHIERGSTPEQYAQHILGFVDEDYYGSLTAMLECAYCLLDVNIVSFQIEEV